MIYALWDLVSRNLVREFDTAEDTMRFVLGAGERNGTHDTDSLGLSIENEHGEVIFPAQGKALAELARKDHFAIPA